MAWGWGAAVFVGLGAACILALSITGSLALFRYFRPLPLDDTASGERELKGRSPSVKAQSQSFLPEDVEEHFVGGLSLDIRSDNGLDLTPKLTLFAMGIRDGTLSVYVSAYQRPAAVAGKTTEAVTIINIRAGSAMISKVMPVTIHLDMKGSAGSISPTAEPLLKFRPGITWIRIALVGHPSDPKQYATFLIVSKQEGPAIKHLVLSRAEIREFEEWAAKPPRPI